MTHIKYTAAWFMNLLFFSSLAICLSACDGGSGGGGGSDVSSVVTLGDSMTAGFGLPPGRSYPSQLAGMIGVPVINQGVSGETSGGGLNRISAVLDRFVPSHICILYGANDIIIGASGSIVPNITDMVDIAVARGVTPIVGTIPIRAGAARAFNGTIRAVNDAFIDAVKGAGGVAVNTAKIFEPDGQGKLQADGLHPNDAGARDIAAAFANKL